MTTATRPWKQASEELEVTFAKLLQVKEIDVVEDNRPDWELARRLLQQMMGACILNDPIGARAAIVEYAAALDRIMGEKGTA